MQPSVCSTQQHPPATDLYHCQNPFAPYLLLPCDPTTCLWDLEALQASGPPGFCTQIAVVADMDNDDDSVQRYYYDEVIKPCVLWQRLFGTVAPTRMPPLEEEEEGDDDATALERNAGADDDDDDDREADDDDDNDDDANGTLFQPTRSGLQITRML